MNRNTNQVICKKNSSNGKLNPCKILNLIVIALLIIGTSVTMISCTDTEATKKATREKIKNEISNYKTMKNGIRVFDMSKDYYFLNKQQGYNYPAEINM